MKRSKKATKPVNKNKAQSKTATPAITSNNSTKTANLKSQSDTKIKLDLKKQNKKKTNNTTQIYVLTASTIFLLALRFIFSSNFNNLCFPIPTIYKETPLAAILDYWNLSKSSAKQFFHMLAITISLYYLFISMRCDPELSCAYCLIIILDPYFPGHFSTSNFLFFNLLISIFSFKSLFYTLTSFKKIDMKYKKTMALICLLNGINLSIRIESISFIFVQIISTFMRALRKKKVNKELLFAPIVMVITELLISCLFCYLFGFPQKIQFQFESIQDFKDELKLYSFNRIFIFLAIVSTILYFSSNFKVSHKIFLFSMLISAFLAILIPIKTNDYSIQVRLIYMQYMLVICFGIVICRPLYFVISGTALGCFIFASWILRYKVTQTSFLE